MSPPAEMATGITMSVVELSATSSPAVVAKRIKTHQTCLTAPVKGQSKTDF